jgi:hypothetical protein
VISDSCCPNMVTNSVVLSFNYAHYLPVQADVDEDSADEPAGLTAQPALLGASSVYAERARYIPMRLDHDERRLLRLLEAALNVSPGRAGQCRGIQVGTQPHPAW